MKMKRKIFFIGIFCLILTFSLPTVSQAQTLELKHPNNGATNVPVDDYFQWKKVSGAIKYVLDIDQFTQSEDNIIPNEQTCPDEFCYFSFLYLTIGNIDYLTSYRWKIAAYNITGDIINTSSEWNFSTEPAPDPPPVNGDENGYTGPLELRNPLKADTLWEAIDLVINFLVLAAFAIAPILIIYSAFLMIFAGGDAVKVNKGKSIISWTLVALAVILFAKGLPSIVKGMFSG